MNPAVPAPIVRSPTLSMTRDGGRRVSLACGLVLATIAVVVLTGWLTLSETLAQVVPGWVALKANSALGFLGVAIALIAASRRSQDTRARIQAAAATLAIVIGAHALLAWAGVIGDIDELLVRDGWTTAAAHPGRPAITTAVALVLLGVAVLPVLDRKPASMTRAALALVAISIAATVSLTWAFGSGRLFTSPAIEPASEASAVCIVLAGLGLIALSRLPILAVFLRTGPVGMAARAGVVTAVVLSLVLASVGVYAVTSASMQPVAAVTLIAALGGVLAVMAAALSASRAAQAQDELDVAASRLLASEERSRSTLDQLPDLVVTKDRAGVITWANASSQRVLGTGTGDVAGSAWDGLVPPTAAAAMSELEQQVLGTTSATSGLVIIAPDGASERAMDVRVLPLLDHDGEPDGLLEVLTDVTDARAAQVTQERLAAVVATSQDAIFTLDRAGIVTTWNDAAERILGWAGTEIIGTDARAVRGVEDAGPFDWAADDVAPGASDGQAQWRTRDGRTISVRVSTATLRDGSGEPAGLSIMASDVTEELRRERALRESEASLRAATQELARSNQSLQEFAAVASHDLKEPLRKIRAFGDRLQRREAERLSEEGRSDLSRMTDAAERMQALITDLLELARVSSAERVFEEVPAGDIVADALDDLTEAIDTAEASIVVATLPTLIADRRQMQRVFVNLIGNALKFHPPDAAPRIEIGADESVDGPTDHPETSIWVQDHGIGFDQRFADRIFDPFERLHGRDTFEGTGIGLAICRQIIEGHGGTIRATSEPGKGTRMTMTLPRPPAAGGEGGSA